MDDTEILELLQAMVRAPSYPGVARQEEAAVLELEAYLREHDIPSTLVEVREGRPNLLATVAGEKPGPHLLFCGHMDTVPPNAGASVDLFAATVENGRLFGRGSVDMKGALAAVTTWIIPAGSYTRVVEQGREVVDPGSGPSTSPAA